ncbi:MAG: alpha/beta hydrolase [Pseudomonadota bacterium]
MAQDRPLPPPEQLRERTISADGLDLCVRIWGDPSKPLVLLQHGAKDHGRSWDWTVHALLDDYCCIVPDLRGHGDSQRPLGGGYDGLDFSFDMAVIVEAILAETGHDALHLIGHSLGGNVALNYASLQNKRVRSIVCIEGIGFSQKSYNDLTSQPVAERMRNALERRLKVAGREPRVFSSREDAVRRLAHLHPKLSDQQAEHLAHHALREVDGGWRWKHDGQLGGMPVRPFAPSEYGQIFSQIDAPVLLMYGEDSWATSPAKDGRLALFQSADLILYKDAGHWLHHDQFDDFIRDACAFLEKH